MGGEIHPLQRMPTECGVGHDRHVRDHFKSVNDLSGHPAGDAVLVEVARRIAALAGVGDLAARVGGDEFVLLACGLDAVGAARLAAGILDEVARPIAIASGPIAVTASVGVAHVVSAADAESVMHLADAALYEAKELGRGRAVVRGIGAVASAGAP